MTPLKPENWNLKDVTSLEPAAWEVLRSTSNQLVVAGPGAGKTELLAQRATYLLETNLCPNPQRILAISFKKDAAATLKERVTRRCDAELASRLDSMTFDAFAASLVSRFRTALVPPFAPPKEFRLVGKGPLDSHLYEIMCHKKISDTTQDHNRQVRLWETALSEPRCEITFDMIKRLAENILHTNPKIRKALQLTYSHVFLDEYQDITQPQFDLVETSFGGSNTILTAVGDNKQQIMGWAGALTNAFEIFENVFHSKRVPLAINYRADTILVDILKNLTNTIDPGSTPAEAAETNSRGQGECQIVCLKNEAEEADFILEKVKSIPIVNGRRAESVCLICRKKTSQYVTRIIAKLASEGIKCRVEDLHTELLKDEVVQTVLNLLLLTQKERSPDEWLRACQFVEKLLIHDLETIRALTIKQDTQDFIDSLKKDMTWPKTSVREILGIIVRILSFLKPELISSTFPQYQNKNELREVALSLSKLLWDSCQKSASWREALDDFCGVEVIPAMTIHKSKGLEYDNVFFIGLEDSAWYSFSSEKKEDQYAFFVAFSRARKRIYFTFCEERMARRQTRTAVKSLQDMLLSAGVQEVQYEKGIIASS